MPPGLFAAWRLAQGAWLLALLLGLWPYRGELYGQFPVIDAFWMVVPNPLARWSGLRDPLFLLGMAAAAAFALGQWRRVLGPLLWAILAVLCARNPVVFNLSWNYVGWSLLACALVPPGEPRLPGGAAKAGWEMPAELHTGAGWILALSYTVSGLSKLGRPEWGSGEAVALLLGSPAARAVPWVEALLAHPGLLVGLSWFVLGAEVLSLPLSVTRRGRMVAWTAMALVQLGILATVQLGMLSLGMLLFHALCFDARWLRR